MSNDLISRAAALGCIPGGSMCDPQQVSDAIRALTAHTASAARIAELEAEVEALRKRDVIAYASNDGSVITRDNWLDSGANTRRTYHRALVAAAPQHPAAPAPAAVPAKDEGWIANQGWEPLIEAELRDGTRVVHGASEFAWDIAGENEPGDIMRCRLTFTTSPGVAFYSAAPASEATANKEGT